jgi:hypothetical protein
VSQEKDKGIIGWFKQQFDKMVQSVEDATTASDSYSDLEQEPPASAPPASDWVEPTPPRPSYHYRADTPEREGNGR